MKLRILIVVAIVGLSGCVAGQSVRLQYKPIQATATAAATPKPIKVIVTDKRTFIVSGEKRPEYIGTFRGGFGNPWDVANAKKVSLANQMTNDLQAELQSLGFTGDSAQAGKTMAVTIVAWKFDAMINGRFWYEIQLKISAANGAELYSTSVKDEKGISGNFMTGAKGAMQKQVPLIYANLIRALIRDNAGTVAALNR